MRSGLPTLLAVVSLHTWTALALRVLDHRLFGATRTIKLKPCQNRVTGQEGTCMFAWDCFSAGGTHLTYCTDSFYTGSCCRLPPGVSVQQHDTPSEPTNSIDSMPYESDDGYKKRTKRPPPSTTKTTSPLTTKTMTTTPGASVAYTTTTTTKPSHRPLPTTTESTAFVGLSTFTPGLITWRPNETTLPYVSDEPFTTVPNFSASSASAPKTTTSATTATTTTKTTRPAVTTTRIPIMSTTFLTTEGTTESQPAEFTYEATEKVTTDEPAQETSEVTETTVSEAASEVYTKSTEVPPSSTQTRTDESTTTEATTQRPSTSSVQSHTWIVNERETTMAIPQSVPTEHTWVVVDEADPAGQQTTTPAPSEPASQSTSSTASMADWSTVTDMVTSISWVDMTEFSTTQKPPPDVTDSTPLPPKPPPQESSESTSAPSTLTVTSGATTSTGSAETDSISVQPETESPSAELVSTTEPVTTTKGEIGASVQTTSTQQRRPTTQTTTTMPSTSIVEISTATTTRRRPIPITFAPTTSRTTTTSSTETTTVPTTTITTPRTTWKYTTVPAYSVSEERTSTTQPPMTTTTRETTTVSPTVPSTLPKTTPPKTMPTTPTPTTRTTLGPTTLSPDRDIRKICGRPRTLPSARIVGGEQTKFAQWPWMISLRQFKRNNFLHKCGAALLNEYWAISAAHCVHNVSPTDILLRLGEYDLKSDREALPHVERRVQIVATHPRFDASTFEYDLALLRLYEPVPFQDNVLPVCVPATNDSFVGRNAVVTGWGRLYEDGPLPSIMQKVSVPIITNKECESMYRKAGFIEDIPNIFICAGLAKGGKDSCEGDSGGPLVLKDPKTGQWSLIGIISWGIGCALPNQPGVYTRITHFADWIRQIIVF